MRRAGTQYRYENYSMCKWCGILALLCGPLCLAAYSAAEQELGRTAALEIRASLDSGQYAQAVNDIESTLQRVEEQLRGYEGQAIPTSLMGDYVRLTTLLSTAGSRLLADTRAAMTPEDKAALETRLAQAMEQAAVRIQHCAASEPRLSAHMEDAASLFTDAAVLLSGSGRTDRAGTCIQAAVNLTEQMASLEQAGRPRHLATGPAALHKGVPGVFHHTRGRRPEGFVQPRGEHHTKVRFRRVDLQDPADVGASTAGQTGKHGPSGSLSVPCPAGTMPPRQYERQDSAATVL